jgi:hypothetical protein
LTVLKDRIARATAMMTCSPKRPRRSPSQAEAGAY